MKISRAGYILVLLVFFMSGFFSCTNENDDDDDTSGDPLVFDTLFADRDTVIIGDSTIVTAIATGDGLEYYWSKTQENSMIIGNGYWVLYIAQPCSAGVDIITCEVMDNSNNSDSKQIAIEVILD